VLEAYVRLILDAMRGDHTLFTTAEGIESLAERSADLLIDPPPAKPYPQGTWGPNAIHQLIAPNAWWLPFRAGVARGQEQQPLIAERALTAKFGANFSQWPHVRRNEKSPRHTGGFSTVSTYLAFSRISTSRQRLVADSGRVSISETRSPTPAMPFSSCAFTFVVVRMILP